MCPELMEKDALAKPNKPWDFSIPAKPKPAPVEITPETFKRIKVSHGRP